MHSPTPHAPQYELVAQINKTKGLDGQLVAQEMGELSVLRPGLEVWIVPPALDGVRHTVVVQAQENFKKHGVLIRLKGVDDRTQATMLLGRYLLAHTEQVDVAAQMVDYGIEGEGEDPPLSSKTTAQEGATFIDSAYGDLGTLERMKPGPAYDIWIIDGPYGRLEIPAVDEYILEKNAQNIMLSLPRGFIEITGREQKYNKRVNGHDREEGNNRVEN